MPMNDIASCLIHLIRVVCDLYHLCVTCKTHANLVICWIC